ncbi:hypothetical protein N9L28_05665 [Luminiphilus sp.]|nr:hypothetical protein [Luminiphilus sp.]
MDENLHKNVAEQKAKRDKRAAKKKAGLTQNNKKALPLMTRREQTERLHELKAQFLSNKKLGPLVEKMFDIAMNDEHDGQMQAMKMIADKILPTQSFSSESKKSSAVQINISGLQVSAIEEKDISKEEVVSIQ